MDKNLMEGLLNLSETSLKKYMTKYLEGKYDKVIVKKDYIYAVGSIPIALLAHMDTVFETSLEKNKLRHIRLYHDKNKKILWSPDGAGFDDRAGVYAIIKLIERGLRPSIILTLGEEHGGIGATAFSRDFKSPLAKTNFLIELDRQGVDDCVFYDCDNEKFVNYISDFGFEENWGTYTDICEIAPVWGVAAVNLSIGYVDEHTKLERLSIEAMESTINKVANILSQKRIKKFKYIPCKYYYNSWAKRASNYEYLNSSSCYCCHKLVNDYELFPVKIGNNCTGFFCADCISDYTKVSWCNKCGEAFLLSSSNNEYLCEHCGGKK